MAEKTVFASETAPRYVSIARSLRSRVESGELTPGDRLPTFAEMRAQGVSQNTMEKAYSLLEADGLIERTTGSGVYVCDFDARRKSATGLIGFLGGRSSPQRYGMHLYGGLLQEGARQAAREAGFNLVLLGNEMDASDARKLDGVLSVELPIPTGVPCVRMMAAGAGVASVVAGDAVGIREAVDHLVTLGHRRIAFLIAPNEPYHSLRLGAYRAALREHGIEPEARWVRHLYRIYDHVSSFAGAARHRMCAWLHDDWNESGCTALLCQNDQTAIGAMDAMHAFGLSIPADVSVVGFDGTDVAEYARPRLTTVEVPLCEIGAAGLELLLASRQGRRIGEACVLPTKLRIGDSTAVAATKK